MSPQGSFLHSRFASRTAPEPLKHRTVIEVYATSFAAIIVIVTIVIVVTITVVVMIVIVSMIHGSLLSV